MKTATLLVTLFAFSASCAYSQAAGAYAGASAAAATSASGSASSLGHSLNGAMSGSGSGVANATANAYRVSGTAKGASSAATRLGKAGTAASAAGSLSAELTQKINSKNAKVGDQVIARVTSTAQFADGTRLPEGTRLIGKVTEVQARSTEQHDGHLAFVFDQAVLRGGQRVPIHAALQSISAPSVAADSSDDLALDEPVAAVSAGARAGGGLLGGGVARTTGLVGGATSTLASAPARVTSTAGATLHQTAAVATQTGLTAATVANLPGVTAAGSLSSGTVLDAKGRNVDLSSGTEMTFAATAQ